MIYLFLVICIKLSIFMFLRYNKRSKTQEQEVLKQGISLPTPVAASQNPLPPPREPPASLDAGVEHVRHQYDLPANTAGHSRVRNVPILPNFVQVPSTEIKTCFTGAAPVLSINLPASTISYRKRKEKEAKTSAVPTKRYKARVGPSQCSKCQGERTPATGHKQYFGNWFCPKTSEESYEEWRARLTEKNYRKKKMDQK